MWFDGNQRNSYRAIVKTVNIGTTSVIKIAKEKRKQLKTNWHSNLGEKSVCFIRVFECNTIELIGHNINIIQQRKQLNLIHKEYVKNSQAVEKWKMTSMKKVVKYRWLPRSGCDGRSMIKILLTTIQVKFVLPHPSFTFLLIKFLTPVFHNFFSYQSFSIEPHLFYSLAVFDM